MTDATPATDWSMTLFLPKTSFPMRGDHAVSEAALLAAWKAEDHESVLASRTAPAGRFVLHDGPPYANGNVHAGHVLNRVLKDAAVRSARMRGLESPFVPGWDCHGLPVEWKVEQDLLASGGSKDAMSPLEFRRRCRRSAARWAGVQAEELAGLGLAGDFARPYLTMDPAAEARTAETFLRLVRSGQVYRGSKPVMWSVAERTALAEAEVEHADVRVLSVYVLFPLADMDGTFAVAWTTTPWTLPGNRALAFAPGLSYGYWSTGDGRTFLLADALAEDVLALAGSGSPVRLRGASTDELASLSARHPFHPDPDYAFPVPFLAAGHVTGGAGTGLVHTAPAHGAEDHAAWNAHRPGLLERGLSADAPCVLTGEGLLDAPGFEGEAVLLPDGSPGTADASVTARLSACGTLLATRSVVHSYPHSWRSKTPVLFRSTPQWFLSMDEPLEDGRTLRRRALDALDDVAFVPDRGRNRLRSMVEQRPDWVLSRQRLWGVPLPLFVDGNGGVLDDPSVDAAVLEAFRTEGGDAWYADGARERFLGDLSGGPWVQVADVLDVWFDSGSTQFYVLGDRLGLDGPADVYLEGSDQHRGWFQSSLLLGCALEGRAPFRTLVTHGFTVGEDGRKLAKSGNAGTSPAKLASRHGTDVLRLWALSGDFSEDRTLSDAAMKPQAETLRRLRNTLRYLLGSLAHWDGVPADPSRMPEPERLVLHRLETLRAATVAATEAFDWKTAVRLLSDFGSQDLSAFYFDLRKDCLYCDPASSPKRRACLTVLAEVFGTLCRLWAPLVPFSCDEAWRHRDPEGSVHLESFPEARPERLDPALAAKWEKVFLVREAVNAVLEKERQAGGLRSSSDAAPLVRVDAATAALLADVDLAEACLVSRLELRADGGPEPEASFRPAEDPKCARSWRRDPTVGSDPAWPLLSARDRDAVVESRFVPG